MNEETIKKGMAKRTKLTLEKKNNGNKGKKMTWRRKRVVIIAKRKNKRMYTKNW